MSDVAIKQISKPVKRRTLGRRIRNKWQLYVFLLLPVIWLIIFDYWPMYGAQIAFRKFNFRDGISGSEWVGFDNFIRFVKSYQFDRVIGNTLRISLYSIIVGFPLPIIFALLLNSIRQERFKKVITTITYMPHFISVVVLVGLLLQLINPRTGIYGTIYGWFNNGAYPNDLMGSSSAFPHLYIWSGIWQDFGWSSIIYTAALSNVSPDLHEAAQIDGAGRFKRMLHVDLPCIVPTATIMLIMRCGKIMTVGYQKVLLMQNTLNISSSELISTYVYKVGLENMAMSNFSYATAIDLFNSVINLILIIIVNSFAKKVGDNSLW